MKIRILFAVLLLISMPLFSQYFLADESGKTIQSGERVFIYGTSGLSGYSVDYDKSAFSHHSLITEKNRICIGILKENLRPGFTLHIYFSTSSILDTLSLVVSPKFLTIKLADKNLRIGDSLSGEILFKHNEIMSGNGIDSLFFILHSRNSYTNYPIKIFSNDSLLDFDYSSGFFNFLFPLMYESGEYCIDLVVFSSSISDTLSNICGFTLNYKKNKKDDLFIIDSEILSNADKFSSLITPLHFEIIKSFFHGIDSSIFNDRSNIVFIVDSINFLFKNSVFFNKLGDIDDPNIFLFMPFSDSDLLSTIDAKLFNDTTIGYSISKNQDFIAPQYLDINAEYSHLFVNDHVCDSTTLIINRNNLHFCFFMPKTMNSTYIDFLSNIYSSIKLKKLLNKFYSIEIFNNNEYNEHYIDVFEISGKFISRINLGYLECGKNILNINRLTNVIVGLNNRIYIYKILRSEKCIRQGIFIKNP